MTIIYRKRENLFEKDEREWRVEDEALVRRAADGSEQRLDWSDVKSVRLRFYPSMAKPWLHQFFLETASARVEIDNGSFAGVTRFENRSADYSPFVRAALERIAALSPSAQVRSGSPPASFAASMIFVTICFAFLAAVLIVIPLPAPLPAVAIAKLAVILYGLFTLPRWIRKTWPRKGDLKSAADDLPS